MSPSDSALSVVTVMSTSTSASDAEHRTMLEIAGRETRLLVVQPRSIDTDHVSGDPVDFLTRDEMSEVENAIGHYLGLAAASGGE